MRWSSPIFCVLVCLCLSAANAAKASDLVPLPPQDDAVAWPKDDGAKGNGSTHGWPKASLSPDRTEALVDILNPIFATDIGEGLGETRAVLIIHKGVLVYERYRDGITPQTRHVSWSVAKSLTTTLVGRAVQLGLIDSLDDPMPAAFERGDPRRNISWRHWLQLLDGLDYFEYGATELLENDAVQMMYGPGRFDQLAYARDNFPLAHPPGTRWNYSTATFHLVARALQSLLPGTCVDPGEDPALCQADPTVMRDWVETVLFEPLGIDGVVEFDAAGTMLGGSNAYMRAQDYARLGLLILRDGVWDGERLLPAGWVDFNRTNPSHSDTNVYGAGFWPSPEQSDNPLIRFTPPYDAFHAGGREGQLIWMIPSRDLVIVRLGLMQDGPENWNALFALAQSLGIAVADTP